MDWPGSIATVNQSQEGGRALTRGAFASLPADRGSLFEASSEPMQEHSPKARRHVAPVVVSILLAASLISLWLPTASPAESPGPVSHCSNARTPPEMFLAEITASRVSCRAAKRFIVALNTHRPKLKYRRTHFRGYGCRPRSEGVTARISCTRGSRVIRWLEGT